MRQTFVGGYLTPAWRSVAVMGSYDWVSTTFDSGLPVPVRAEQATLESAAATWGDGRAWATSVGTRRYPLPPADASPWTVPRTASEPERDA